MKRIGIILATVLLAAIGIQAPALAYDYTMTEQHCQNHGVTTLSGGYTVTLCIEVGYRRQSDGDGIYIEDMWTDINNGCSNLDSGEHGKLYNQWISTNNPITGGIIDAKGLPDSDCHVHRDLELRGPDTGKSMVRYEAFLNLDQAHNDYLDFTFNLCANGGC